MYIVILKELQSLLYTQDTCIHQVNLMGTPFLANSSVLLLNAWYRTPKASALEDFLSLQRKPAHNVQCITISHNHSKYNDFSTPSGNINFRLPIGLLSWEYTDQWGRKIQSDMVVHPISFFVLTATLCTWTPLFEVHWSMPVCLSLGILWLQNVAIHSIFHLLPILQWASIQVALCSCHDDLPSNNCQLSPEARSAIKMWWEAN